MCNQKHDTVIIHYQKRVFLSPSTQPNKPTVSCVQSRHKTFHCSFLSLHVEQLVFPQSFLGSRLRLNDVTKHDFVPKVQYYSSRGLFPFKVTDDIPPGVPVSALTWI